MPFDPISYSKAKSLFDDVQKYLAYVDIYDSGLISDVYGVEIDFVNNYEGTSTTFYSASINSSWSGKHVKDIILKYNILPFSLIKYNFSRTYIINSFNRHKFSKILFILFYLFFQIDISLYQHFYYPLKVLLY